VPQPLGEVHNNAVARSEQLVYVNGGAGQAGLVNRLLDVVPFLHVGARTVDHHVRRYHDGQFVEVAGHEHIQIPSHDLFHATIVAEAGHRERLFNRLTKATVIVCPLAQSRCDPPARRSDVPPAVGTSRHRFMWVERPRRAERGECFLRRTRRYAGTRSVAAVPH
jgi:hypothetical protein